MLVFVYGSLLDLEVLRRKSGDPRLTLIPASLAGWHRLWRERYPTLRRGGVVQGGLVRVSARALRGLNLYEGDAYRLCAVTVRQNGRPRRAWVWIK